jgi:hypothetical protein
MFPIFLIDVTMIASIIRNFLSYNGQTEGRFWEAFLDSVDAGGIYDLFEDFKRYLSKNGVLSISH